MSVGWVVIPNDFGYIETIQDGIKVLKKKTKLRLLFIFSYRFNLNEKDKVLW
jgi:hypothetical protein